MGSNHRNRKGRPRNAYRKQDSIDTTTKHNQSKLTAGAGISFVLVLPWLSQFESRSHARYFQRQIDLVWALFYLRIFFLVFCLVAVCVLRLFLAICFGIRFGSNYAKAETSRHPNYISNVIMGPLCHVRAVVSVSFSPWPAL